MLGCKVSQRSEIGGSIAISIFVGRRVFIKAFIESEGEQ